MTRKQELELIIDKVRFNILASAKEIARCSNHDKSYICDIEKQIADLKDYMKEYKDVLNPKATNPNVITRN